MGILTLNTGSTFNENVSPILDIKSAIYTPYLNKYKKMVAKMGSREVWFNEALSNNVVQLNGAYTAGSGTMTLDAPTTRNPYKVTENVTHIKTQDDAAVYKITAFNTSTYIATIVLVWGSDSSLADNVELYLGKYDRYAAEYGVVNEGDELQFSTSDINYPTFIYDRLKSADGNEDGRWVDVGMNEASIAHQEDKLYAQLLLQLERDLFYSTKTEGSNPATRQANKLTAGLDSRMGGLSGFVLAQGGRIVDNTSVTPVSEADIISDVEYIREAGGLTSFLDFERNESQLGEIDMWVHEVTLSDIQKFIRLERDEKALSKQVNGDFGSWAIRLIANGAYVNVRSTSGVKRNDYFMTPANADIEHKFLYFFDKIMIGKTGHNEKCMYGTAVTSKVANGFTMVQRKNLARLGS